MSDSAEAICFSAFRSIIDVLTTCELLLLLFGEFEVQSIFEVENSRSVHLGRRKTLESSRSTFRRGFDMPVYVNVDFSLEFHVKIYS